VILYVDIKEQKRDIGMFQKTSYEFSLFYLARSGHFGFGKMDSSDEKYQTEKG